MRIGRDIISQMASSNGLTNLNVIRKIPELIPPAKPTPHELRVLSDIDDQQGIRFLLPFLEIYRNKASMAGRDPAKIIRDAVAKALVFYYPFAGRLRECATNKLVVECTGEGVLFVEADADVTLRDFGDALHPPFPTVDDLLVPGDAGLIHSPLLLIQVTRLKCGGFIFAGSINHTMCDGAGIFQFLTAVGELARGAEAPSVRPVWERHLLSARYPPRLSFPHPEYDAVPDTKRALLIPFDAMVQRSFFFGAARISALRRTLPTHLRSCSDFDLVSACAWRFQTIATAPDPGELVRLLCVTNIRKRLNPPLPDGYYGNAVVAPAAVSTAKELSKNPLHYAVELVMKAKREATEEYVRSTADLMVMRGRPSYTVVRTLLVSFLVGVEEVDFGWGKAAYGGTATGGVDHLMPGVVSFFSALKNYKGEDGILVPMCLLPEAMEVFEKEFEMMTNHIAPAL